MWFLMDALVFFSSHHTGLVILQSEIFPKFATPMPFVLILDILNKEFPLKSNQTQHYFPITKALLNFNKTTIFFLNFEVLQ